MAWKLGQRIPAGQLNGIIEDYETGPVKSNTLPLYQHDGIYDATVEFLTLYCETLGISKNFEGGNFVICLGPNKGTNGYRG